MDPTSSIKDHAKNWVKGYFDFLKCKELWLMWITNTDYYSKLVILSYDYTKLSSYDHNVTTTTTILNWI